MKVKRRMTSNPITATPEATYGEALRLMEENQIKHLPILDQKGKLVGMVSHSDMLRATPSPVTSLSVWEISKLLDQVTMQKIMSRPVVTVDEECSLPSAAWCMLDNDVGCLPVMRHDKLVGILTDTDIFKTFVEVMGGGEPGSRVEVQMADQKGQLARVANAFAEAGGYIVSVTSFRDETGAYTISNIKERGAEEKKLLQELEKIGTVKVLEFRLTDKDCIRQYG